MKNLPERVWEVWSAEKIKYSGWRGEAWWSLGESGRCGRLNKNKIGAEGPGLVEPGRVWEMWSAESDKVVRAEGRGLVESGRIWEVWSAEKKKN